MVSKPKSNITIRFIVGSILGFDDFYIKAYFRLDGIRSSIIWELKSCSLYGNSSKIRNVL
jgi:hypothetical protein